jgi:hypothetical protein
MSVPEEIGYPFETELSEMTERLLIEACDTLDTLDSDQ